MGAVGGSATCVGTLRQYDKPQAVGLGRRWAPLVRSRNEFWTANSTMINRRRALATIAVLATIA